MNAKIWEIEQKRTHKYLRFKHTKSNPLKNGVFKKEKTIVITEQTNNQKACTSKRFNRFHVI